MSEENKQPEEDQTPATETPEAAVTETKTEKPHPLATLKEGNKKVAEVKAQASEKVKEALKKQADAIQAQKETVTEAGAKAEAAANQNISVAQDTVAELEAKLAAAKAQLKQAKKDKKPTVKAAKQAALKQTEQAIKDAGDELTTVRKQGSAEVSAAKKERTKQATADFGDRITVEFNEATDWTIRVGKGVGLGVYRPAQIIGNAAKEGFKEGYSSETKYGKRAEEIKKKKGMGGPS